MKKILSMAMLVLACVLVISACSGKNAGNDADPGNNGNSGNIENPENNENPGDTESEEEPGNVEEEGSGEDQEGTEEPVDEEGTDETGESGDVDEVTGSDIDKMVKLILEEVEQRPTMELEAEMIEDQYYINPELLEEYAIHLPMFNISTNEFAILQVKDANDLPTIEAAIKQRAEDVQKSFEQYLPDQYENAKNYKLAINGNYVLFVIDEPATVDAIIQIFDNFLEEK